MNANGCHTHFSLCLGFTSILLFWIMRLSRNERWLREQTPEIQNEENLEVIREGKGVRQLPPFTAAAYGEACEQIALGIPTPSKHMHSHWCHPRRTDTERHGSGSVHVLYGHTHTGRSTQAGVGGTAQGCLLRHRAAAEGWRGSPVVSSKACYSPNKDFRPAGTGSQTLSPSLNPTQKNSC